jgi:hypothetical protein
MISGWLEDVPEPNHRRIVPENGQDWQDLMVRGDFVDFKQHDQNTLARQQAAFSGTGFREEPFLCAYAMELP